MAFGIYIHYPYCLQQCTYCDFATALHNDRKSDDSYIQMLIKEITLRSAGISPQTITSVYLGGGTPSLMHPSHILEVFTALEKQGFQKSPDCEITIEINPDTIDAQKLQDFQSLGVNRFSVGAQSFNDQLLKYVGRKHSAKDTEKTLELLSSENLNFSVDLLFSLPHQKLSGVADDLQKLLTFKPKHFSPYLLTLPSKHKLQAHRASDEEQVKMLNLVYSELDKSGYTHYEISNFAKLGFESKHNLNAWLGQPYWGLGMSAHSYLKNSAYGVRFWNPPTVKSYDNQLINEATNSPYESLPQHQVEILRLHEALSDYNHTRLRLKEGITWTDLERRFGSKVLNLVKERLEQKKLQDLLVFSPSGAKLSQRGIQLSNLVFAEVVFLLEELP